MKGYIQISWKFSLCVFVALSYLGVLVLYLKFPSGQGYFTEDQPLTLMLLPTTTTMKSKTNKLSYLQPKRSTITDSKRKTVNKFENKVVDEIPKTSSANLSALEKKIKTNAKIVVVLAYMRTGSTFMGGMFHHYPGTFYLFEPIRNIFDIFDAAGDNKQLMYISGKKRRSPSDNNRENVIIQDVHNWLSCNFHGLDIDTLTDIHHLTFKDSMYDFYNCAIDHVKTIKKFRSTENNTMAQNWTGTLITKNLVAINDCLAEAKQKCLAAPLRVIKFIRLRMPLVAELLPLYPNMKVIYLQRDPRGILRSRIKTGLVKGSKFSDDVLNHCNNSLNDIQTVKTLANQYPGRLKPVIYEDVAENPVEILESVFSFCDLNFSSEMKNYTISLTSLGGSKSCSYCIERGNSTETAYQWRKEMTILHVYFIDKQCSAVYDLLGYKRFSRLADLRNFSLTSRTSTRLIL